MAEISNLNNFSVHVTILVYLYLFITYKLDWYVQNIDFCEHDILLGVSSTRFHEYESDSDKVIENIEHSNVGNILIEVFLDVKKCNRYK